MAPADLKAHIDCVADFASDIDEARVLHSSCENKSSTYHAKTKECVVRKSEYHDAHCGVENQMKSQCATYSSCHELESSRYSDVKLKVEKAEVARKHQVVAIEKIKCYLTSIVASNYTALATEGKVRMAACNVLSGENASASYTINYTEPPLLLECPWKDWLDTQDVDCAITTAAQTTTLTTTTTTTLSTSTTTTTTTTTVAPPTCNRYQNKGGRPASLVLGLGEGHQRTLKARDCSAFSLWLTPKGLRNERQCGPHPGDSIIQPSNFQVGSKYWITIKRVGRQGTMTLNEASSSNAVGGEVASKTYNINYAYSSGIQTVGMAHKRSEYFGGVVYCLDFQK